MEYLPNGELFKSIAKSGGTITELTCKKYLHDICSAVSYMHARSVYHRDIKPENILISDDGKLKLADYGWAVHAPAPNNIRSVVVVAVAINSNLMLINRCII